MKKTIIATSLCAIFAGASIAAEDIIYSGSTVSVNEQNTFSSVEVGTKVYVTDGSNMKFEGRGSSGVSGVEKVDVFVQNNSILNILGHDANQCLTANSYTIDETSKVVFSQTNAQSKITGNTTFYVKGLLTKDNYGSKASIAMNEGAHIVVDGGTISSASYAVGGVIDVVNGGKFIASDATRVTDLGGDFTGINYYGTRTEVNVKNSTFDIAGTVNVGLRANATTNKDAILKLDSATAKVGKDLNIGWNTASYSDSNPNSGKGFVYVEGNTKLDVTGNINVSYQATAGTRNTSTGVLNIGGDASVKTTNINIGSQGSVFVFLNGDEKQIDSSINNAGSLFVAASAGLSAGDYSIALNGLTNSLGATVKAYGGTINGNIFTAFDFQNIALDSAESVNVVDDGRVVVDNGAVAMAFNADSAVVNGVSDVTDSFSQEVDTDFAKMGAYEFDVVIDSGDTVVLSFYVGDSTLTAENFSIFHKTDGSQWGKANDISNVSYDGEYLSFVVSSFSSYGYVAVPEPSTYAVIFGVLAFGFVVYRRENKNIIKM